MLKKLLTILTVAIIASSAAVAVELRDDHPQTYVVKKGDTLWSISRKFLRDPWNWPEIWHANQQVQNPHLIYPGDVLSLVYSNGRLGLEKLQPQMRETEQSITAVNLADIEPFLGNLRVLDAEEFKSAPYVLALEDGALLGKEPYKVYVRGNGLQPGQHWVIARPTMLWREVPVNYPWESPAKRRVKESLDANTHMNARNLWYDVFKNRSWWRNTRELGREVSQVAIAEVISTGDPSTLMITESTYEVQQGDILIAVEDTPYDATYYPRAVRTAPENMRVIGLDFGSFHTTGTGGVIALTHGSKDGIRNGDVFAIYHQNEPQRDNVKYGESDVRTAFRPSKAMIALPDEYAGHAMVFRTFNYVSYAIMMEGEKPVKIGDRAMVP